jgi:hypothetical protein
VDDAKEEFARLIAIMGWTKSEAARELGLTPSGINHLLNPSMSHKPRPSLLNLLKLRVASAHPDAINARTFKAKVPQPPSEIRINEDYWTAQERQLIDAIRRAPYAKQQEILRVIYAMLAAEKSVSYRKGSP